MPLSLDVLVLPAFENLAGLPGELTPWERVYDLSESVAVRGVPHPVRHTGSGLGVVPTGVGKTAAATTVTAVLHSDRLALDETLFCTVGVAGAPPELPIGSVVLAETIVDWDDKCRFDPDDADTPLARNPYTDESGVYDLDPTLLERARRHAEAVSLRDPGEDAPDGPPIADDHPGDESPTVTVGVNLCGDELWHGTELADQAAWLVEQYDRGPYRVTEMEDAGTAAALARVDRLDQYLSVRGVANHDRPTDGRSARESFFSDTFENGFATGIENAVTVARRVVANELE